MRILFILLLSLFITKSVAQETIQVPNEIIDILDSLQLNSKLIHKDYNHDLRFRMHQDSIAVPTQIGYTSYRITAKDEKKDRNKMTLFFYEFQNPSDVKIVLDLLNLTFYHNPIPKGFHFDNTIFMKSYTLFGATKNYLVLINVNPNYKHHVLLDSFISTYNMKFTNSHYYLYNPRPK